MTKTSHATTYTEWAELHRNDFEIDDILKIKYTPGKEYESKTPISGIGRGIIGGARIANDYVMGFEGAIEDAVIQSAKTTADFTKRTYNAIEQQARKIASVTAKPTPKAREQRLEDILGQDFARNRAIAISIENARQKEGKEALFPSLRETDYWTKLPQSAYMPVAISSKAAAQEVALTTAEDQSGVYNAVKSALKAGITISAIALFTSYAPWRENLNRKISRMMTPQIITTTMVPTAAIIPMISKSNIIPHEWMPKTHLDTLAKTLETTLKEPSEEVSPYIEQSESYEPTIRKYLQQHLNTYKMRLTQDEFDNFVAITEGFIEKESAWTESITSKRGAAGLMQVMYKTAKDREKENMKRDPAYRPRLKTRKDLYKPDNNIYFGTQELARLYKNAYRTHNDFYTSIIDVTFGYNGGEDYKNKVMKYLKKSSPLPPNTIKAVRSYTAKIIKYADGYKKD